MDFLSAFLKAHPKLVWSALIGALGLAAGSGGTVALARNRLDANSAKIESLEKETRDNREDLIRLKSDVTWTRQAVDRIEQKLDRK